MKNISRYLAIDLKIYTIVIFLLAGCDTNSQKTNQPTINHSIAQQSSGRSSSLASNSVAATSPASIVQSSKAYSQQSSSAFNANKPTALSRSSLSLSSAANQTLAPAHASAPVLATSSSAPTLKTSLVGISGVIKLTGKNGEVLSPEGVIVNLEPTSATEDVATNPEKHQYDVFMKDKTYTPKFMTVRKNDQLNFTNKDQIKHNVFSTSAGNGFDLGTYGEGGKNNTILKTPGIVKVYCNIHPEMAFFISVSQHNYSYITKENGAYEINNLPPGEYKLSAWHIRGEIQQVVNLQIPMSKNNLLINTESFVSSAHKNKFGEDYKVQPALFKDEFY